MLTLHHLENSQSIRIVWLLEELQIPYDLKIYQRTSEQLAPPEYKAISPLGTSPTITDDGDLALSESNAIIEYILDKAEASGLASSASSLRPTAGSPDRTNFLFWFHTSAASFQGNMAIDSLLRILPKRTPWPISAIMNMVAAKTETNYLRPRLDAIFRLAEQQLQKTDFLAGNSLTAADVAAIYSFDAALARMPDLKETYPACAAWLDRMRARPALVNALQKVHQETVSFPF